MIQLDCSIRDIYRVIARYPNLGISTFIYKIVRVHDCGIFVSPLSMTLPQSCNSVVAVLLGNFDGSYILQATLALDLYSLCYVPSH